MKSITCTVALALSAGLAPAAVVLDTSFDAGPFPDGYADGNLAFQPFGASPNIWLGQSIAQVDSTAGTVTSVGGPFDRNMWNIGANGGTGGSPSAAGFAVGDVLSITFDYQFELSGDLNRTLGRIGIRNEGPNAGNGFNSTPLQGFYMQYNVFDSDPTANDDGGVKFFPDFNDVANSEALIVDGSAVGISPGTADGSAADLLSDVLRISYELVNTGGGLWDVQTFDVDNVTQATFVGSYGGPTQTISYADGDAFFAQQLMANSDAGASGIAHAVRYEYIPIPEPNSFLLAMLGFAGLAGRRRR